MYAGKVLTDKELAFMEYKARTNNLSHIGQPYMPFEVRTLAGTTLNNDSLKGKVCLLVFFYPGSNQINADTLKAIQKTYSNQPFQIYLFTQETSGLKEYMQEQGMNVPLCYFPTMQYGYTLNYENAIPSYILLSKAGIVAKLSGLERNKPEQYRPLIEELLKQ
jgi:peroxiredoxin